MKEDNRACADEVQSLDDKPSSAAADASSLQCMYTLHCTL
jgi:hypothetical protein